MTGAVVNLNKARKAKARAEDRVQAAANAVKFGRTKAEKVVEEAVALKSARAVDNHRRDQDEPR